MSNYLIGYQSLFPDTFTYKKVSEIADTSYISGTLTTDRTSPYFPNRGDEKVMREDVKASLLLINHLMNENDLKDEIEKIPLFVANGAFIENTERHLNRVANVYRSFTPDMSEEEKIRKMYLASPPLVALETLTNSTMSFIAQYSGLKCHNATFGNTSISGFHAINEAISSLTEYKQSIVCSSNCGGDYSFLMNSSIVGFAENWKESAAVATLLFSNELKKNQKPLCKITHLINGHSIPNLEQNSVIREWKSIIPNEQADLLIYSGAFSSNEHEEDRIYCQQMNQNTFSFYDEFGNLGASNMLLGIIKGVESFNDNCNIIDILDRDIFGRESLVRIEKC